MRVTFWGTRGSVATGLPLDALRAKIAKALLAADGRRFSDEADASRFVAEDLPFEVSGTHGGETSCVQVEAGDDADEAVILDLGTGARRLAGALMAAHGPGKPRTYNVLLSHLHWDHVSGFPFFVPAYIPGNVVRIHSCHAETEAALRHQHRHPGFPVDFSELGATIEFVAWEPDRTYRLGGFTVTTKKQHHKGDSYGYRLERNGKVVVYSTDSEHKLEEPSEAEEFAGFFADADLVIFDAMYTFEDAMTVRRDWGHSSSMVGVELCHLARAKRLALYHHDPGCSDRQIADMCDRAVKYEKLEREQLLEGQGIPPLEVMASHDGLVLDL